jgi:hypothetical protein
MGDHKASIFLKFSMHDVEEEHEMYINYDAGNDGCDQRIKDFFSRCHDEAMINYQIKINEYYKKERERQLEINDKIEFERLCKKFGAPIKNETIHS